MQFSSRDVVHLCYDAANYFDIARVMVGEDRKENAILRKIYIHEYLSERTRPLWYISPTIEGTRWIVCNGQRMRVMENRRAAPRSSLRMQRCFWLIRDSPSRLRVTETQGIEFSLFLRSVVFSSAFIARVFPFVHTPEFHTPYLCGFNATMKCLSFCRIRGRYNQGKTTNKWTIWLLTTVLEFLKIVFSILSLSKALFVRN